MIRPMNLPMKKANHGGWRLAAALVCLAVPATGWSQGTSADAAWNSRMAALQEEQDAQSGVAVSIVFDDSGSMNDNHKLVMAKRAFQVWIEHAPESYRFGLTALNAGKLVPLQRNDRPQILKAVNGLEAKGGTPLADTVAQTAAEIRQRRAKGALYERQVVVILTDGEDTTRRGIKGVQEEIRKLRADRVEVIAFGYQGEGDYMKGSATHFYSPENEADISKGLNAIGSEIGDTSDVVVDDATRAQMQQTASSAVLPPSATIAAVQPAATPAPTVRSTPFSPYVASTPTPSLAPRASQHHSGFRGWGWLMVIVFALMFGSRRKRS